MPHDELVSIVVPVYNVRQYLTKCVYSIAYQTYKELEIILVDDGSSDDSGEMSDEKAMLDDRVIVIHKCNGGLSSARNYGIKVCRGDFISFVDSDDYINSRFIALAVENMKSQNCQVVQCSYRAVYDDKDEELCKTIETLPVVMTSREALLSRKYKAAAWGKLYQIDLFEDVLYPDKMFFEDEATYYKILYKANRVVIIDEVMYYYYQTPNSIMRGKKANVKWDFVKVGEDRIEYFNKTNDQVLINMARYRFLYTLVLNHGRCIKNKCSKEDCQTIRKMFVEKWDAPSITSAPFIYKVAIYAYKVFPRFTASALALINK